MSNFANEDHAAQIWRELVDGSVECELCNEPYDESDAHLPRLLACGHTFCQSCLEEWSAVGVSAGSNELSTDPSTGHALTSLECPTCRRVTSFNANDGPRTLPKNFELLRVRHEMEAQTQLHLQQLKEAWTTQVLEKEKSAKEAEENAMMAQRESIQAAQRAIFLAKQVEINEQEKRQAQEIAQEARRKALVALQQAEALQAETESLKQRLHHEAQQLQRVKKDASSAAAEAAELQSRAEQLQQQVEYVRAQLSLHAGRHDPSKLVVLVVEPTTVGSWLMPYTRYAVISIARSEHPHDRQGSTQNQSSTQNQIDPFLAAKTWIKMRHVPPQSSSVKVYRRYSDFVWLHHELHRQFPFELVPSIPGKQLFFFKNKEKEFVGERMRCLQAFIREIVRHPSLSRTEYVRAFLLSTTEELDHLRNVSRLHEVGNEGEDDGSSFLSEVEASEAAASTTSTTTASVGDGASASPAAPVPAAAVPRSSWAWGAVSALTSGAAKLVTSTGTALSNGIAGVSTSAAVTSGVLSTDGSDGLIEKSLSSSLSISDEETHNLTTFERHAIEKRKQFVDISKAHTLVTQKGSLVSRRQRQYAHHLHRFCEWIHEMDQLDQHYASQKKKRHSDQISSSSMQYGRSSTMSTYTARQVEEDARACLESERPFQEKASEVFNSLSMATSNDAECMEYALLEISRMQTLHLGAIEDAFTRLRKKEDALESKYSAHALAPGGGGGGAGTGRASRQGSFSKGTANEPLDKQQQQPYGSPPMATTTTSSFSSSSSSSSNLLMAAKKEELQLKRSELTEKVHRVDPPRAKLVLDTLQQNVKEMHTLAVARRKLHETSYQQLLAACRSV